MVIDIHDIGLIGQTALSLGGERRETGDGRRRGGGGHIGQLEGVGHIGQLEGGGYIGQLERGGHIRQLEGGDTSDN